VNVADKQEYASLQDPRKRERTGPRQFLREVRSELKRVNWPSRREVTQYSVVVLVTVTVVTLYIFGLDQMFGQLVLWMFG
jgi:preprotein translocase subunit SecE